MSIKGNTKEAAGFIKEETGEMLNDSEMAHKGRALRNEGRVEDGELPKTTPVPVGGNKEEIKQDLKDKKDYAA